MRPHQGGDLDAVAGQDGVENRPVLAARLLDAGGAGAELGAAPGQRAKAQIVDAKTRSCAPC